MWILESNGDFLQGKRMWLKPGKKYLFGRVKKDGVRFAIDHKTVSRKHFVITVDPVSDRDVGQVHARTKITITDEKSKAGTNIDGELIRGKSQELRNVLNSVRPGTCPHELIIRWEPCVMTFMLTKKEIKNGDLKAKQDRLRDLDIRAVGDYLTEQTTILVAQKRNTAKGLQALIEGKPIVTEAYIDALIYASTPIDLQEEENLCPLETDFDDAWPDPALQLPPPGKEPTKKPDEAYKPDHTRAKVFDKYTFIFFDQSQYDTLLPPITTGHGKALLFKVDNESTTVEEGYEFVKNAVGNLSRLIPVGLNESAESRPWLRNYIEKLCTKLNVEAASQSDFLDTILANNASQLRKSRSQDESRPSTSASKVNGHHKDHRNGDSQAERHNGTHSGSAHSSNLSSRGPSAQPESASDSAPTKTAQRRPSQDENPRPTKRARYAPPKKPRAAFDDDFDPDAIAEYEDDVPNSKTVTSRQRPSTPTAESENDSIKEEPVSTRRNAGQQPSPASSSSDDDMDDLLPAAAAMTREKARREAEDRRNGIQPASSSLSKVKQKPEKEVKLLDVREAVRAQREAEQERERKQREEMEEYDVENQDLSGPANLVQIQTFSLPVRKRTESNGLNGYRGETWKPEWDGRKNFKGFRRARDMVAGNGEQARRREKIIVPLVPARTQDYGLGERYWEKTQEEKDKAAREKARKKRASQKSQSQTQDQQLLSRSQQSHTLGEDSDSDVNENEAIQISDDPDAGEGEATNPEALRLQAEAESVLDHPIDVDAPRQTRGHDTQTTATTKSTTQSKSTKAGSKRHADKTPPSTAGKPVSKKQKTLPVVTVHDSNSDDGEDSDDLKFKVGRGRKTRTRK